MLRASKTVLTTFTFTQMTTWDSSLIAFTIFLQACRFLTIASFCMTQFIWVLNLNSRFSNDINFWFECIWVSLKSLLNSLLSICWFLMIVTSAAITKLVTCKSSSKTIAVKLQTFALFTVTSNSSCRRIALRAILFGFLSSYFLLWNFWGLVFLLLMLLLLRILGWLLLFDYDWDLNHVWLRLYPFGWFLRLIRKRFFIKSLLLIGLFIVLVFVSSRWKPDEADIDIYRRFL